MVPQGVPNNSNGKLQLTPNNSSGKSRKSIDLLKKGEIQIGTYFEEQQGKVLTHRLCALSSKTWGWESYEPHLFCKNLQAFL